MVLTDIQKASPSESRKVKAEKISISGKITIPKRLYIDSEVVLPLSGTNTGDGYSIKYTLSKITLDSTVIDFDLVFNYDLPEAVTNEECENCVIYSEAKQYGMGVNYFLCCIGTFFNPGYEIYKKIEPVIYKLACATDDIRFYKAFIDTRMYEQIFSVIITCKGKSKIFEPLSTSFPHFADGLTRSPTSIGYNELKRCFSTSLQKYEIYCLRSDLRYYDQQLEAYSCFRKKTGINPTEKNNYTPYKYLANCVDIKKYLNTTVTFSKINPEAYEHCRELYGSRHEIVHNGQNKVRIYSGSSDKIYDLRELDSYDITKFRTAALSAVRWLQSL